MFKKSLMSKKKELPSLYDAFCLGDRVSRVYKDGMGNRAKYEGIVLGITEDEIKVCWDKQKGSRSISEMESIDFTDCSKEEVFRGNNKFSPIRKKY